MPIKNNKDIPENALVYSSDFGQMCPICSQAIAKCSCSNQNEILGNGKVRIKKESKGRGGKTVSIIEGLPETKINLEKLCKELKRICGSGGTVKDSCIEIQGEHGQKLLDALQKKYKDVKLAY